MKNKTLYLFIPALFIVSVFVWQYTKIEKVVSSTDPVLIPIKNTLIETQQENGFQQLSKNEKLEKVNEVLEQMPPQYKNLKRQYQIAMSLLPDITFWGRVVDQHNQPVANAEIYYTGTNAYLSSGGGRGRLHADEQGYFEIDTTGASLSLTGVVDSSIDRISTGIVRFESHDGKRGYDNWKKYTTKETAYIVHAWRLSEYKGTFKGSSGGHLNADGNIYTLRFSDKWNAVQRFEGVQPGHLRASCTRPHMESNRDYGDWSVSITPINGGIQETNDLYLNIAPESGYQPSLDIVMKKGDSSYKHEIKNKRYYFNSNSGKEYGSLQITMRPFRNAKKEACNIDIRYKINPTGSRNLELKRAD